VRARGGARDLEDWQESRVEMGNRKEKDDGTMAQNVKLFGA
jgi:hypothetical protein